MVCSLNFITGTTQVTECCKYCLQGPHVGQPWIRVSVSKSWLLNENPMQDNPDITIKYVYVCTWTHMKRNNKRRKYRKEWKDVRQYDLSY